MTRTSQLNQVNLSAMHRGAIVTASHHYITCGLTNGDTGEHGIASLMVLIESDTVVFYIHPLGQPETTHIVTARRDDAPVTLTILERMGIPLPPSLRMAAD